jgi:hypothetical protein
MPRRRAHKVPGQQTVVPSAARTATGNGDTLTGWHAGAVAYSGAAAPQSRLTISAGSGTSLTVIVEDSPDGATWTTRDTYPAQTGVATVTRALPTTLAAFQRVRWTIVSPTPSFTFSVQFAASTALLQ